MADVSQTKQAMRRPALIALLSVWAAIVALSSFGRVADVLHETVTLPLSFRLREALGHAPRLDSRLKIFCLDDGTYASLRRPSLTGTDWSTILGNLAVASPAAIITTHMFGTGEFDDPTLQGVVSGLKARGTKIVAASFAYPGHIPHRAALDLERPEFAPRSHLASVDAHGAQLYGPDAAGAALLSAIGHVSYDGTARTAAFLNLGEGVQVPHLALAAASFIVPSLDSSPSSSSDLQATAVDASGRLLVDFAPYAEYAAHSKALKGLLSSGASGAAFAERHVSPGDTVLILTDMYTGKANFVSTPQGPLPGGYVAAAMLNSVLQDKWLTQLQGTGWIAAFLLGLVGIWVGRLAPQGAFFVSTGLITVGVTLAGVASFVYGATLIAWPTALLAYLGPAFSLFAWRVKLSSVAAHQEQERLAREAAKLGAVVRTSQMFAHDVRKPFSILKIALQATRLQPNAEAAARYLQGVVPEIERAMTHVEDMIHDVIEIDGAPQIVPEPTPVEDLIGETLRQVFAVAATADVKISYRFEQTLEIAVDRSKVRRALVNIADNAVQAMHGAGRLWVTARDVVIDHASFVEMSIGNSGSYIAPDVREKIFEAFYTSGKSGGTGLGLALARKVVEMHGGSIRCVSTPDVGTEFVMTLPVAQETPRPRSARLPATAAEYRSAMAPVPFDTDDGKASHAFTTILADYRALQSRSPRALVLDDDSSYREGLRLLLADIGFDVATAHDAQGALQAVGSGNTELIVADYDLGGDSPNGIDVVAALRALGCRAHAVIHSNEVLAGVGRADQLLAKPASRGDLLLAAIASLRRAMQATAPAPAERPTVAVLDDNAFVLEAWTLVATDADIITFLSPAAFWARIDAEPQLLGRLDAVITDLHFGDNSEDGLVFAAMLKRRARVPVFLSTDGTLIEALGPSVDARIAKEPVPFADLRQRLKP